MPGSFSATHMEKVASMFQLGVWMGLCSLGTGREKNFDVESMRKNRKEEEK